MFILSRLSDNIRVQPSELSKPPLQSVTEVIQERYFDKVIPQLGLVVTLYDVLSIEGGFIHPNDGAAYFKVEFRVVVFRPFVGEVITGKLRTCSKEGLYISLGDFFDDVFVPEHALQEPSFFNDVEKLWLWKFDGKKGTADVDGWTIGSVRLAKHCFDTFSHVCSTCGVTLQAMTCLWT
jgi:DNA-directed RNA polymerase subunit RpoE